MHFVKVKNGNYDMYIDLDSGTKIRKNDLDFFEPEKPESMDIKITGKCTGTNCKFCHEDSGPNGKHGDIMNAKFIETLLPYTELAIGGGNPLEHPDLVPFLEKCKKLNLIPNITVNQVHFIKYQDLIKELVDKKLIYGLGVSLVNINDNFLSLIKQYPNAVLHMINGIHTYEDFKKLYDKDLKVLILGYKQFRRGKDFYSKEVEDNKKELKQNLKKILSHFEVVSFDNLALDQLDVKSLLTEEQWNEFYMGADGSHTLFIDLVEKTFSKSSTTPIEERKPLLDDIKSMFDYIRRNY